MTTEHDRRSRIVVSWLREDAHEDAERVLLAALNEIDHTHQRRSWWPAWRFSDMNNVAKALVATAAVIAVGFVGITLLPGSGAGPGAQPSSSPTAEPTATPRPTAAGLPQGAFDFEDNGRAMTVTIPASGWTFNSQYTLLAKGNEVANVPQASILFWAFPAGTQFFVYGDPCRSTSTTPDSPVSTVGEIASGLAAQASRDASEPTDITVGGHAGKSIVLHVPDDAQFGDCELGEFVSYGTETDALTRTHQGPGQIDELWILDVDSAFVIIDVMYRADTPPALIDEMRTIAESATFDAP